MKNWMKLKIMWMMWHILCQKRLKLWHNCEESHKRLEWMFFNKSQEQWRTLHCVNDFWQYVISIVRCWLNITVLMTRLKSRNWNVCLRLRAMKECWNKQEKTSITATMSDQMMMTIYCLLSDKSINTDKSTESFWTVTEMCRLRVRQKSMSI